MRPVLCALVVVAPLVGCAPSALLLRDLEVIPVRVTDAAYQISGNEVQVQFTADNGKSRDSEESVVAAGVLVLPCRPGPVRLERAAVATLDHRRHSFRIVCSLTETVLVNRCDSSGVALEGHLPLEDQPCEFKAMVLQSLRADRKGNISSPFPPSFQERLQAECSTFRFAARLSAMAMAQPTHLVRTVQAPAVKLPEALAANPNSAEIPAALEARAVGACVEP